MLVAFLAVASAFDLPNGWSTSPRAADENELVHFQIAVRERNLDQLKQSALAISTPGSSSYGAHMTVEQIAHMTAPDPNDLAAAATFLTTAGIDNRAVRGNIIDVSTSVAKAAALLNTELVRVTHPEQGERIVSIGAPTLPAAVAAVFGFGLPAPPQSVVLGAPNAMKVTPKVLADTYAVTGNAPSVVRGKTSHQAVAEFQGQYMSKDDLTSFFTNISPPGAKAGDDQVAKFVGVDYKKGSGVEALLDIEYIMGVAPGVATEFWEWPGMDFCGDLMQFTTELLASNVTVMSISYGYQGDVSRLGCKDAELKTVDANFAKLAAKGTSLMISSGDSGSGYTGGLFSTKLYPSWPASSPWVTAVGATTFIDNQIGNTQKASAQFGSGGGFSAMFTQDDAPWQKDLVAAYVAKGDSLAKWPTSKDKVDFTGRATPDVAALGEGYQVWVGSRFESVGGTSASSPAFAGYVSLLNEARRQAGKPNMGFLNPFLYQNAASGFTDIVNGTNAIARSGLPVKAGYACAVGWDAATGLGVPKFDKLLAAALALETAAIVEAA